MKRLWVGVAILVASTLVALTLIVFLDPPDAMERQLQSHGRVSHLYVDLARYGRPNYQMVQVTMQTPSHPARDTAFFKELKARGWRTVFSGRLVAEKADWCYLYPPNQKIDQPMQFFSYPDHCRVVYMRRASPTERRMHAVKAFLHIPD